MKTSRTIILFTAIIFLSFSTGKVWAFRCGSDLVSEGNTKTQVMATCGNPTSKEKTCENNEQSTTTNKYGKTKKVKKCGTKLDTWYYNCGDNDFIYKLIFEDGKITNITTDGRGRGKSDCQGK